MRWGALGAAALTAAAVVWGGGVQADQASCKEFRDRIVEMEDAGAARPPGWFVFDQNLRRLYQSFCIDHPTRTRPVEYWYREDGTSTGVRTTGENGAPAPERPKDGAYATTQEIGDACLKAAGPLITDQRGRKIRAGLDPSLCALDRGVIATCINPIDNKLRTDCAMVLGPDHKVAAIPKGEALPAIAVGLDGGPYVLGQECQSVLQAIGAMDDSMAQHRPQWLQVMQAKCPDFLAAIERRAGAKSGDAARFWPAFAQLVLNGFPTPQQVDKQRTLGDIANDGHFKQMCNQARENMNTCELRQKNMRTAGTTGDDGTAGQAGAFNDCRILYAGVANMCTQTEGQAERIAALAKPAPPKPQPPQQPQQLAKPADNQSRPPPQPAAPPQMSAQCQQLVANYVQAAQANDGARAVSGYNALKSAGGCGVLNKVDRPLPQQATAAPGPDPRFPPSRGATPLSDSTIGACDLSPAECAARVQQLKQSTSAQAQAALFSHSIGIGLQLGSMMAGGMMMAMPQGGGGGGGGGGGTNMNSIGPGPVKGTYGQGAPSRPAPPSSQSTITGTK
jgi:hypothetical protein